MRSANVFCSRKDGATVNGRFHALRYSELKAKELERKSDKKDRKRIKAIKRDMARSHQRIKPEKPYSNAVSKFMNYFF